MGGLRIAGVADLLGRGPADPIADGVAGAILLGAGAIALRDIIYDGPHNPPAPPSQATGDGNRTKNGDPNKLPWGDGPPNGTTSRDNGAGPVDRDGQIKDYGPDGYPTKDMDFGHDHNGSGDPHCHDIGRPANGGTPTDADRRPTRPAGPNE